MVTRMRPSNSFLPNPLRGQAWLGARPGQLNQRSLLVKDGVKQIVGKQISSVVVATSDRAPRTQMFLVFADGTYFEIWGDAFTGAGGIDPGGVPEILRQVASSGGRITATYPGPVLP